MRGVVLISFLLCSCVKAPKDPRKGSYIHEDFTQYVLFFENYYETTVYDIPITYKELEGNYIGVCKKWTNGLAEIFINPNSWKILTEKERQSLIIHELGHCHINQDHRNFSLQDGCQGSIMDEYAIRNDCLEKHWDYYLEEMK